MAKHKRNSQYSKKRGENIIKVLILLILCFSATGNTAKIAKVIQSLLFPARTMLFDTSEDTLIGRYTHRKIHSPDCHNQQPHPFLRRRACHFLIQRQQGKRPREKIQGNDPEIGRVCQKVPVPYSPAPISQDQKLRVPCQWKKKTKNRTLKS